MRRLVGDLMQTEDLQKRASAAASAMYLTNIEALRPQLRREGEGKVGMSRPEGVGT